MLETFTKYACISPDSSQIAVFDDLAAAEAYAQQHGLTVHRLTYDITDFSDGEAVADYTGLDADDDADLPIIAQKEDMP